MPDARAIMQGGSQAIGIFSKIMQSGLVQSATGYLGTPIPYIGSDVKTTRCREVYKKPELQPSWVREKIPTFGIVGGILALFGGISLGRYTSDPESPAAKLGFLGGMLKLAGLLGILGSIYSHVQGTFVRVNLGEEEQALYVARGDIPVMLKDADFDWAEKRGYLRDKDSRHPQSMSYNPDEVRDVLRPIDQLWAGNNAVRAFYIGGPGTGKTHTMYHTLDQFRQYAQSVGKKVSIKEVNADILATGVAKKNILQQTADVVKDVAGEAGQQVEQISSLLSVSTETRFQMVINSFIDFATEGPDDEIRVISIDEIDKIWKLAEGDKGEVDLSKMAFIATRLQKLLECQKVHILMTGNGTVDEMCGIEKLKARGITDVPPELVGLRSRLLGMQVHMTEATLPTACDMICKELEGHENILSNDLKQRIANINNDDKVHDKLGLISDDIPGFDKFIAREDHLTKVSPKVFEIENVDPNRLLTALAYTKIHGRIIHRAISKYVEDVQAGKVPGSNELTIDGLKKYIEEDSEFIKIKQDQEKLYGTKVTGLKEKNENNRIASERIEERLNHPQIHTLIEKVVTSLSITDVDCKNDLTTVDLKKILFALKCNTQTHPGLRKAYENITNFLTPENLLKVDMDEVPYQVFSLNQNLQLQITKSTYDSKANKDDVDKKIKPYTRLSELRNSLKPGSLVRVDLLKHLGNTATEWIALLDASSIYAMEPGELKNLDEQADRVLEEFAAEQDIQKERIIGGSDPVKELQLWFDVVPSNILNDLRDKDKTLNEACTNLSLGHSSESNSRVILRALKTHYRSEKPPVAKAA